MNIIRTTALELSTIPAITYKQKLASGGAGIKIFRLDAEAAAVFTIDRRSGEAVPYGAYEAELFPDEAVDEALELTLGLPYTARRKLKAAVIEIDSDQDTADDLGGEDVIETDAEKTDMVNSEEYCVLVERYTNEKGKLNYALMNKDFIQFAGKSKAVADMIVYKVSAEDILLFIVKNRAAYLADKKDYLSDEETAALIETLDEIDPRSAFKELTAYIRRMLAKGK